MAVWNIFWIENLEPGQTFYFLWNNLPFPAYKAFALDVRPYYLVDLDTVPPSTTELEVTRVWRRTRIIKNSASPTGYDEHYDIRAHIKNVGNHVLHADVYLVGFA